MSKTPEQIRYEINDALAAVYEASKNHKQKDVLFFTADGVSGASVLCESLNTGMDASYVASVHANRVIQELKQQRAELLEALKLVQSSGSYYMMHGVVVDAVNKAITKAEAAE